MVQNTLKLPMYKIMNKCRNHLWYLTAEAVAMAFFDTTISIESKRKMIVKLTNKIDYRKIFLDCKKETLKKKNCDIYPSNYFKTS